MTYTEQEVISILEALIGKRLDSYVIGGNGDIALNTSVMFHSPPSRITVSCKIAENDIEQ